MFVHCANGDDRLNARNWGKIWQIVFVFLNFHVTVVENMTNLYFKSEGLLFCNFHATNKWVNKKSERSAEWVLVIFPRSARCLFQRWGPAGASLVHASLPFKASLNPWKWNVPLPNLEFLFEDLCWRRAESCGLSPLSELLHKSADF